MKPIIQYKRQLQHAMVTFLILLNLSKEVSAGEKEQIASPHFLTATIGNLVWFDVDSDGVYDATEPGFEGVEVVLQDPAGLLIATTTTDFFGNYSFSGIDAGPAGRYYQLFFKCPSLYKFSPRKGVTQDPNNSDANLQTGKTDLFILMPGEINNNLDVGLVSAATGTLPLHSLDLSALLKENRIDLNWVAENEMDTKTFIVQQSIDGVNYLDIGSQAVSGPVNTPTMYHYKGDISGLVTNSILYYRIKAVDNLQRWAYSNVVTVRLSRLYGVSVWPNPFVSELRVSYKGTADTKLHIEILTHSGIRAWESFAEVSKGLNQLPLPGLERIPSGVYLVKVADCNTGQVFVERLIK